MPYEPQKIKIVTATPMLSPQVSVRYSDAILDLRQRPPKHTSFVRHISFARDIVRARSRLMRQFLETPDATHLLFIDADNVASRECLEGMLAEKVGVIGAPYPRREFHPMLRPGDIYSAMRYSYMPEPGHRPTGQRIKIRGLGFGFMLLRRDVCEQLAKEMQWHVSDGALGLIKSLPDGPDKEEILTALRNTFIDDIAGNENKLTVALFSLYNTEDGLMLGEDYSFCARCRDAGIDVWMYIGPGSPVPHVGEAEFTGQIKDVLPPFPEVDV